MNVTVHKLLIHGINIIKYLLLPEGQLSEDVIEIDHKDHKKIKTNHSKKTSRIDTNSDIFDSMQIPRTLFRQISREFKKK